jgi:hypothetical protein
MFVLQNNPIGDLSVGDEIYGSAGLVSIIFF